MVIANTLDHTVIVLPGLVLDVAMHHSPPDQQPVSTLTCSLIYIDIESVEKYLKPMFCRT